jgi:hypothetical protein
LRYLQAPTPGYQRSLINANRAKKIDRTVAKLPSIPKELVNQFLTGPMTGEAINAAGIAFKQALIGVLERRTDASPGRGC